MRARSVDIIQAIDRLTNALLSLSVGYAIIQLPASSKDIIASLKKDEIDEREP